MNEEGKRSLEGASEPVSSRPPSGIHLASHPITIRAQLERLVVGNAQCREGIRCHAKANTLIKLMESRFYYPTNAGSLGGPRRAVSSTSPIAHQMPAHLAASDARRPMRSPQPTVLVVEDDDISLFVLKSILGTKGYRVLEAWDGRHAIKLAQTETLDLMLLDLQLPELNGLGVISRLREKRNLESLPIVIMTGQEPEKNRGAAIAAGCDDFLLKPIDADRLDAVLDYFVPFPAASVVDQTHKS